MKISLVFVPFLNDFLYLFFGDMRTYEICFICVHNIYKVNWLHSFLHIKIILVGRFPWVLTVGLIMGFNITVVSFEVFVRHSEKANIDLGFLYRAASYCSLLCHYKREIHTWRILTLEDIMTISPIFHLYSFRSIILFTLTWLIFYKGNLIYLH